MLMAIGYYWFPQAIAFTDDWRRNDSKIKHVSDSNAHDKGPGHALLHLLVASFGPWPALC